MLDEPPEVVGRTELGRVECGAGNWDMSSACIVFRIASSLLEGDGEFHSGVKDRLRLAFASVEGGPTLVEQFNKTVDAARPGIRLRYLEAYRAVFAYEQATVASIQQIAARQLSHVAGEARARVKLLQDDIHRIDQETARLGGAVPQRRSLIDRLDTGSEEF